jgi:trehalose synthase-fused probable maltokinase
VAKIFELSQLQRDSLWGAFEAALQEKIKSFRWFGSKAEEISTVNCLEMLPLVSYPQALQIAIVEVVFKGNKGNEIYSLPLLFEAKSSRAGSNHILSWENDDGWDISEASGEKELHRALFQCLQDGQELALPTGRLSCYSSLDSEEPFRDSYLLGGEQSNSSFVVNNRWIFKIFRKLDRGENLDIEVTRFLTDHESFERTPNFVGELTLERKKGEKYSLLAASQFVENDGDAWSFWLESLKGVVDAEVEDLQERRSRLIELAKRLGQRTAQMHVALASGSSDSSFSKEEMNTSDFKDIHLRVVQQFEKTLSASRKVLAKTQKQDSSMDLEHFQSLASKVMEQTAWLLDGGHSSKKCRVHGDFHLGQVLVKDEDFYIIDFEGEPARSWEERRALHSPLKDVAGMLRSFHYAAFVVGRELEQEENAMLSELHSESCEAFKGAYLKTKGIEEVVFHEGFEEILSVYVLEKALYELSYELNNRPDWIAVPLAGIKEILV